MTQAEMDLLKERIATALRNGGFDEVDVIDSNEIGVTTPALDFVIVIEPV